MKKVLSVILLFAISLFAFAACKQESPAEPAVPPEQTTPAQSEENTEQPTEITKMYITINGNK